MLVSFEKNENAFQNCIYMINQDQKKNLYNNPLKTYKYYPIQFRHLCMLIKGDDPLIFKGKNYTYQSFIKGLVCLACNTFISYLSQLERLDMNCPSLVGKEKM